MLFQLVQILYWIALATWFGGALFVAVAAPVIFRTVREHDPLLPRVLSVNLEGQHGTLLAGAIVANILRQLTTLQLVCAGSLILLNIVQWFIIDLTDHNATAAVIRSALIAAAAGVVLYDWRVVSPQIEAHRKEYIEHADEPEIANPAKEAFDREHRFSVMMLQALLFLLLGLILFSPNITPRGGGVPGETILSVE
jgi:hypothetical protein